VARWLVGKDYPKSVYATGGMHFFDDDQETPDTHVVTWDYDKLTMVFELSLWTPYMTKTPLDFRETDNFPDWRFSATQVQVYGTKGLMFMSRHGGGWQVCDNNHNVVASCPGRRPYHQHIDNFFECIQSRRKPNSDIEDGHKSTILCHLGNISYRVGGRKLCFDSKTETITNNQEANQLVKRTGREPYAIPEVV
jgi:hypothetical protein